MDARSVFAEVIREAGRLGLASWERLVLILAVALLLVMGRRGFDVLRTAKLMPPPDPVDEGGAQPGGHPLPTDQNNPGGGPTGGMG